MADRDKHWDFTVHPHEVEEAIAPVIADFYSDEHEKRTVVLASWLTNQMNCGALDFAHDPERAEDAALDASEVIDAFERLFRVDDRFGWKSIDVYYGDHAGDHNHRLLFIGDPDDFDLPYDVEALAAKVAEALVAAVADERVTVESDEPYDSCRNCGGYHNVNWDCSDDD